MKSLLLTTVLLSSAVSGAEAPPIQSGPNPTQFTGRVFTLAADDPLKKIKPPAKIGYPALILDKSMTVRTDIGQEITTDRVQFMHRNFKMPMHQADAMTEASCLQSDA
ncbi:hypothetical protein [Pseudomonas syringae group genomosp. 3]|uniref:hypothetical protein n=1 Tax=Pseudomonas syringae group genomosp. 3 TaxID=251701 RepID=UPI0005C8E324|nr:hypothetical protein [Pseudomonas syringae group genomosp. 3]